MEQNTSQTTPVIGKTFIIKVPGSSTTNTKNQTTNTIKLPINLQHVKTVTKLTPISALPPQTTAIEIIETKPDITSTKSAITSISVHQPTKSAVELLERLKLQGALPPIKQATSEKVKALPVQPPPMIALKKREKPVIPLTKMKVMKNMNMSFENIEVAQETALKGNLIKSLTFQGVAFKQSMIASINEFFNATRNMFTDKITSLSNEVSRLEKDCIKKTELIKELHALLGVKGEDKSSGDEMEYLGTLKLTLHELGGRFLKQVESSVEMAVRDAQDKQRRRRQMLCQGATAEAEAVRDAHAQASVSIGALATQLAELLRSAGEDERSAHAVEMEHLLNELLPFINAESFAVDGSMIEQVSVIADGSGGGDAQVVDGVLLKDVNMGYPVRMPAMAAHSLNGGREMASLAAPQLAMGVQKGDSCVVPDFYHYLKNCNAVVNEVGDRPIHRDVAANNIREVKKQAIVLKLLSASLDVYNDEDYTPLHLAIIGDASVEIVSTLLRYGADFRARDGDGNTVLHLGIESDTLGKLFHPSVRQLVDGKLYHRVVDVHNNEGFTPLQMAALKGNATHVQDLLLCHPNIDLCDTKSGRTALFHAIENNHIVAANLLKEHKACPYIRNYAGTSIIDALCEVDSDFSPEMKKLFYNDRMRASERGAYEDEAEVQTTNKAGRSTQRRKRTKLDQEAITKKRKP